MMYEIKAISEELDVLMTHSDETTLGELADRFRTIVGLCLDGLQDIASVISDEEKEYNPNEPKLCIAVEDGEFVYTYKDPEFKGELKRGPFDSLRNLGRDYGILTDCITCWKQRR